MPVPCGHVLAAALVVHADGQPGRLVESHQWNYPGIPLSIMLINLFAFVQKQDQLGGARPAGSAVHQNFFRRNGVSASKNTLKTPPQTI